MLLTFLDYEDIKSSTLCVLIMVWELKCCMWSWKYMNGNNDGEINLLLCPHNWCGVISITNHQSLLWTQHLLGSVFIMLCFLSRFWVPSIYEHYSDSPMTYGQMKPDPVLTQMVNSLWSYYYSWGWQAGKKKNQNLPLSSLLGLSSHCMSHALLSCLSKRGR